MNYLPLLLLLLTLPLAAQPDDPPPFTLDNPVDSAYLLEHLTPAHPRLILTPAGLDTLRRRIATDTAFAALYGSLRARADALLDRAPLRREMTGRRLLSVSREALRRHTLLALAYRIGGERRYLDRLGEELSAVCRFADWNPSHFLDVAEMSLAVAIALDWCGEALPDSVSAPAYTALLELGLRPSLASEHWWVRGENNWNQVCHGGTIAAALTLAEREPTLAASAIARALDGLPYALSAYAPDGVYPEGSSYWVYATSYSVATIEMLRSALGADFGLAAATGFLASADFQRLNEGPGGFYNFGDSRRQRERAAREILAWFAAETGRGIYYDHDRLLAEFRDPGPGSRFAALSLPWLARVPEGQRRALPTQWSGGGTNPVFFLRDVNDPTFFLAGKGGSGDVSHGNLDAGSFVLDWDSVRWSVDLGMQNYNDLEQRGIALWGRDQYAERWTLISKNNYNHSTLTVNDSLHRVAGYATVTETGAGTVEVDLTPVFAGQLAGATRIFRRRPGPVVEITDFLRPGPATRHVSWRLLTQAAIELTDNGALLRQDGRQLQLELLSPAGAAFSVVSLNPPPLPYDLRVPGLKRLEIRLPAAGPGKNTVLRVRLSRPH